MLNHINSATSVGFPIPLSSVSSAVVLSAIAWHNNSSWRDTVCGINPFISMTVILFSVSVPVLSVHITVTAPMVSQAWSFLTRLLLLSILRILSAKLKVTAIGKPSGTAITMSVTAIMKYFNTTSAILK